MNNTAYNTHIDHFIFDSGKTGPTLVIMGAVHGNEKCGTEAIMRFKEKVDSDNIQLTAGRVIVVPIANPGAYAANTRFLERNLNRSLYPKPAEQCKAYEDHLDSQICAVLDQADYLLDIHSYSAGGPPFVFVGGNNRVEKDFAKALDIADHFVWNWDNAFKDSGISIEESWGTTGYVRHKNIPGITLECGQHDNPDNTDIAYTGIIRALQYLKLASPGKLLDHELNDGFSLRSETKKCFAKMVTVIKNDSIKLAREFKHFERIKAGETLAFRDNGESITASADGYAILPNPGAKKGAEMLYLAVEEEPLPPTSPKSSMKIL